MERTINALYKRDKPRLISKIKKVLHLEYEWLTENPITRQMYANDIFSNSIIILLEKYSVLVQENYIKSEKCLFQIIMREIKRFTHEKLKERMIDEGKLEEYKLNYNELQRKRKRDRKKGARKRYYLLKQDPVKFRQYVLKNIENQRRIRQEKKLGIYKDKRKFENKLK